MSDGVDPTINGRPISELKVVELKEELNKRGLPKVGNKNVLYDRLKKFLLDEDADACAEGTVADSSQAHDVPSSPPANPLVAEYLAKQEAALREARKDAEAALRTSSGEETSPVPRKVTPKGRKPRKSSTHIEADEPVIERRTTRSKTRSGTDQDQAPPPPAADVGVVAAETSLEEPEGSAEIPKAIPETRRSDLNQKPEKAMIPAVATPVETEETRVSVDVTVEETPELPITVAQEDGNATAAVDNKAENESVELVPEAAAEVAKEDEAAKPEIEKQAEEELTTVQVEAEVDTSLQKEPEENLNSLVEDKEDEAAVSEALGSCVVAETPEEEKEQIVEEISEQQESPAREKSEEVVETTEELSSAAEESRDTAPASTSVGLVVDDAENELSTASSDVQMEEETISSLPAEPAEEIHLPSSNAAASEAEIQLESSKVERKRRWKETSSSRESNDKDIVIVSVTTPNVEEEEQEKEHVDEKSELVDAEEENEETLEADEKDEELDYEEPIEHPVSEFSKHEEESPLNSQDNRAATTLTSRYEAEKVGQRRDSELETREEVDKEDLDEGARRRRVSPARYPVSQFLLIRQLTRPFTVKQLKSMLASYGTLVEDGFWIDNIKSKCIVKYSSMEEATVARGELHNLVWPLGNPKELKVDFIDESGFERFSKPEMKEEPKAEPSATGSSQQPSASLHVSVGNEQRVVSKRSEKVESDHEGPPVAPTRERSPLSKRDSGVNHSNSPRRDDRRRPSVEHPKDVEKKPKKADELFQKTKAQPSIYFAPLTEEQILERAKQKSVEAESVLSKRNVQTLRGDKHKEEESGKELKRRSSPPSKRQRSPIFQKRRRLSRSRSPPPRP